MKKLILIACIVPTILVGQNLEDAYGDQEGQNKYSPHIAGYYAGEYQVFLDKLYWERVSTFAPAAKSYSIKSFHFHLYQVQ